MSKFYTYQAWFDTFKPILNQMRDQTNGNAEYAFETYGEEVEYVKLQDENNIWTEVDGDEGTYIVAGMTWVNRIQYYITENPWEDAMTEVPTWCYRDCDCRTEDNDYEHDPDCTECDYGVVDIPCETVEDLKAIYGEDAPIVG